MRIAKLYYLSAFTAALFFSGSAFADSFDDWEKTNKASVEHWAAEMRNGLTQAGKTNAEKLTTIQSRSLDLVLLVDHTPCRDNAQAKKLEDLIHQKFHELSNIAVLDHAANMSCSSDHKLRPTLRITKLTLSGSGVAAPQADEVFVNAETLNMLLVDKWATDTRKDLTKAGKTNEEKLNSIQAENQDFLDNVARSCRDDAQARKLEARIHQKFHELSNIADITHGVNMSCSPDHKLRPTLWITKITPKP